MNIKRYINNPLAISVAGNVAMILVRMFYTKSLFFGFILWNLFLASIPLIISSAIYRRKNLARPLLYGCLFIWLLFLPNAPYIITDLVHLEHRPPAPFWYDMLIFLLSAINGLVLGFLSISQVEHIFRQRNAVRLLLPFRLVIMMAMSYGVYLGRYLRFNSWDAILNPFTVAEGIINSVRVGTLGFVLTFSFILYSFYRAILRNRFREAS